MTRFRLAAAAALSLMVLPAAATGGEAPGDSYRSVTACKTRHTETKDFVKLRTIVRRVSRPGRRDDDGRKPPRRGTAAAVVPVEGARVITKLIDLSTPPNNVVGRVRKSDLTNADGIAKTRHRFNAFGNYRFTVKVKVDGEVVAEDQRNFGVGDRESGPCEPPISAQ